MTIIYCDLCGKALDIGNSGVSVTISEYRADSCDDCAKQLIKYVKSGPNKSCGEPLIRTGTPLIPSIASEFAKLNKG